MKGRLLAPKLVCTVCRDHHCFVVKEKSTMVNALLISGTVVSYYMVVLTAEWFVNKWLEDNRQLLSIVYRLA